MNTHHMQHHPLLISELFDHGTRSFPDQTIVSHLVEGAVVTHRFSQLATRTKQLAHALKKLGMKHGDTVSTLAWNTHRHLKAYFAISNMGAIIHTINPRLFAEQLLYILNDAQSKIILVDSI